MAKGPSTQLTRQVGEHLVAAKLGRLGYFASPFAGNVPLFDLLAADHCGQTVPIQVKTINGPSWQLKADTYLNVEVVDGVQYVKGKKPLPNPKIICIFILLRPNELDEYYVFRINELQEIIFSGYHGGKRPKNPNSMHFAIYPKHLAQYRDKWSLVNESLAEP